MIRDISLAASFFSATFSTRRRRILPPASEHAQYDLHQLLRTCTDSMVFLRSGYRLCARLYSTAAKDRANKGPIPFSQTPAKDLSVRDSLGVSAQERFARRLPYNLIFSTGLFLVVVYFAFIRKEKDTDQGLQKLAEKIPALEDLVEQAENVRTASSETTSNASDTNG